MDISKITQVESSDEKERRRQHNLIQTTIFNRRIQDGQVRRDIKEARLANEKTEALQSILATTSTHPPLVSHKDCLSPHLLSDQPNPILCAKDDMIVDTEIDVSQVKQEEDEEVVGQNTVKDRPPPERD